KKIHLSLTTHLWHWNFGTFCGWRARRTTPKGCPMAMIPPHLRPGCVAALLAALLLAGCVDSADPLLTGAQPTFGPTVRIHGYSLVEGRASGPDIGNFRWDGAQYRVVGRPTFDVAAFTAV